MRNISQAKAELSSLIQAAVNGEEVVIDRAGTPIVRIVPFHSGEKTRKPGGLKVLYMADDFDAEDPEINRLFYGDKE